MTPQNRDDYDGGYERKDDIEEVVEHVVKESRRSSDGAWFTPQAVSAIIGILGIVAATFWTLSDFRISMSNQEQRMSVISERMLEMDKRLNDIDRNGPRSMLVTDSVVKNLQKQIDDLKDTASDLNGAILQHNEAMMDLYKKDMADGKRDFRIPPNAPKYHRTEP